MGMEEKIRTSKAGFRWGASGAEAMVCRSPRHLAGRQGIAVQLATKLIGCVEPFVQQRAQAYREAVIASA